MTNIQVKLNWFLTAELQLEAMPVKQEGTAATTRKEGQQTKKQKEFLQCKNDIISSLLG